MKHPDWISKSAKQFWESTAPEIEACGFLTNENRDRFVTLSVFSAILEELTQLQNHLGVQDIGASSPAGVNVRQVWKINGSVMTHILRLSREFGMTPISRTKLLEKRDREINRRRAPIKVVKPHTPGE